MLESPSPKNNINSKQIGPATPNKPVNKMRTLSEQDEMEEDDTLDEFDGLDEYAINIIQDPIKAQKNVIVAEKLAKHRLSIASSRGMSAMDFRAMSMLDASRGNSAGLSMYDKMHNGLVEMTTLPGDDPMSRSSSIWGNCEKFGE